MALNKITSKNFLSKGAPYIKVYSGWYNTLVDYLNGIAGAGFDISVGGSFATQAPGQMKHMPIAPVPGEYHVFFDDFIKSAAAKAPEAIWTINETAAGCTQLLIDAAGGVVQLTNEATTDDSGSQIQLQQETFRLIQGKELWFETRIRVTKADVTNLDFAVGLAVTENLTAVADNRPANGIVFTKTDAGIGTIFFSSSDNGTDKASAAAVATIAQNVWIRLGFHFDGGATGLAMVTPYINGVPGLALQGVTYATMSELAPVFMVRNGDATTQQVLDIDYVYAVQRR